MTKPAIATITAIDHRQPGPGRDHAVYHASGSLVGWHSEADARSVQQKYLDRGHHVHIRFPDREAGQ